MQSAHIPEIHEVRRKLYHTVVEIFNDLLARLWLERTVLAAPFGCEFF
jgi:hypothetical protein